MLEIWRARQQEEMRLASYYRNSLLYPSSRPRELSCSPPYAVESHSYARRDRLKGEKRPEARDRYGRAFRFAAERNLKDSVLLKRTERLINSPGRDIKKMPPKRSFIAEVFQNGRRPPALVFKSNDAPRKSAIYRSTESRKPKLTKLKSRSSSLTKPKKLSSSGLAELLATSVNKPSTSIANHFRTPTLRNDVFSDSILREIHSLFEKGELPSKRWKDKYKNRRKVN